MKPNVTHSLLTVVVTVVLLTVWWSARPPTVIKVITEVPRPPHFLVGTRPPPQRAQRAPQHNMAYRRRICSGVPQHYTSVGYLRREQDGHLYPLYGRASRTNAQRWNYHTVANGIDAHGNIRLPLLVDKSDCTRDMGCRELYNDDPVAVPGVSGTFRAQLYSSDFSTN